jgi:DNA polymerase/3'-5' exonuclease PolX
MYELYYHVPKGDLEEEGKINFSKRTMIRNIVCVPHEKWKMTWTYWIGSHSHRMQIWNIKQLYRHIQLTQRSFSQEYAIKLVESIGQRCEAIIDNGSDWTKY